MSLRYIIRVLFAFALSIICGGVVAVILSPLMLDFLPNLIVKLIKESLQGSKSWELLLSEFLFILRLTVLIFVAPILLTGLIGFVSGWRSGHWYITGTAIVTTTIPWLTREQVEQPVVGDLRITACLAIIGASIGLVYWLIAVPRNPRTYTPEKSHG